MNTVPHFSFPDSFRVLRHWINNIQIQNPTMAHWICRLIPSHCVFERNITWLGRTYHIPALCQLNPIYNEIISLRFRALTYLADNCGEDISRYLKY